MIALLSLISCYSYNKTEYYFALLLQKLVLLSPLSLQLFLLLFLIPLFEDFKLPVGVLNVLIEFCDFGLQFFFALFSLVGQFFALFLDLCIFSQQIVLQLFVHKCFSPDSGFDVFDFSEEALLGLVEDASLVGYFCLGFF